MSRATSILAAVLILSWGQTAMGALERVEEAYEVGLDEVTLPTFPAGVVSLRPCAECEAVSLPDAGRTVYRLDRDQTVSLMEFRAAALEAQAGIVYVFYSTADGVVNRIVLSVID